MTLVYLNRVGWIDGPDRSWRPLRRTPLKVSMRVLGGPLDGRHIEHATGSSFGSWPTYDHVPPTWKPDGDNLPQSAFRMATYKVEQTRQVARHPCVRSTVAVRKWWVLRQGPPLDASGVDFAASFALIVRDRHHTEELVVDYSRAAMEGLPHDGLI